MEEPTHPFRQVYPGAYGIRLPFPFSFLSNSLPVKQMLTLAFFIIVELLNEKDRKKAAFYPIIHA